MFVKIKEGKGLNKTQEDVFEFLLTECFPNYGDERGGLLERINSKSWEEVAFGDIRHQKMANVFLQKNGRYEQIKKLFDTVKQIQTNDILSIRENLVKISRLFDEIYQCEDCCDDEINNNAGKMEWIQDNFIEEKAISELHSHILAFMYWIPIIDQNKSDEKTMESIDNIIEQIKVQVCKIINSKEYLKKMLEKYPTNYCDSIFIRANDINLRKLLIKAMYYEPYTCMLFQHFYKKDILGLNGKGDI